MKRFLRPQKVNLALVSYALCLWIVLSSGVAFSQDPYKVEGVVTDGSDGSSIPGANVVLKGTSVGTVTDAKGAFSIQLPDGDGILVFSFVGYTSQEIHVDSRSRIEVALEQEAAYINEVVVTALGIKRETQSLGYAIQEIDGDKLTQAGESNFTNLLAGKVAGLDIKSNTAVGSSTRVILRGESSLNLNGNQPLFVIDGVPINNNINNTTSADFGNGASEVNPADIETLNVLKGPAAAALYGARASNGVIIITTKSGKSGRGLGISVNSTVTPAVQLADSLIRLSRRSAADYSRAVDPQP